MSIISFLRLLLFTFLLASCTSVPVLKGNQQYSYSEGSLSVMDESGQCYMSLHGKITAPLKNSFALALRDIKQRSCSERILILTSHGGDLDVAIEIGLQIREAGFVTDMHGYCDSACAFLYIAGNKRIVHAQNNGNQECKLGVHQPTNEVVLCQCIDLTDGNPQVIKKIKNYFSRMLPKQSWEALYQQIFSTSCKQILYLETIFLMQNGIATEIVSTQYR